ncbi:GNAT family N-acetyltransferase [Allosaccharopolyspora coralli]|uniref:GNAT family N-acetyltransferase n=1 Tax=Allosaccharopolyspora coralli TaxID=2665642 RepID=A0A5Q3Q8V4_9PSEU|nr:GNAT family N-acetyltransferase [Allosaccharopolyspora coralli]QGK70978.1 GNAT family N-acetyltransferase [Allosaccharopolyspora coralli]
MNAQSPTAVHRASVADLDPRDLYRILWLRLSVFVIEQECPPESELDGRDLEPSTRHYWITGESDEFGEKGEREMVGYLRVLCDSDATVHIGRVCVAKSARGTGVGRELMRVAVDDFSGAPIEMSAQTHALGFYRSFGFVEHGEPYREEGIPHVAMRREPDRTG